MSELGQELSWDSEITKEAEEFELLPAGIYDFEIESMERGRFAGSEKMSACNTASLTIKVDDGIGNKGKVFDTLYLNSKAEWRLSQFFTAIGQKKKGEALRMNWDAVPLAKGRLKLAINKYEKNGETKQNNRVMEYITEESKAYTAGKF